MPQRKKSARELALSGAARAKPGRYAGRGDAPQAAPLGNVPRHLNGAQKAIWRQVTKLAPAGVLGAPDEFALEIAVRLIERSRREVMKPSEISILVSLLGKLGLTPSDRAKLTVQPEPDPVENDPWAELERLGER
jgi:hypothetical protein